MPPRLFELNDTMHLSVADSGSGPAVVFLHALGASHLAWALTVPAVSAQHRCVVPDLPGFGDSGVAPALYSVRGYAAAIWSLLDAMALSRVSLVGNSLGALVALEMAACQPERTDRLVMMSPPGADARSLAQTSLALVRWVRDDGTPRLETVADAAAFTVQASVELVALANCDLERSHNYLPALTAVARFEVRERALAVTCPTMLLFGSADQLVDCREAALWQGWMPESVSHVLPGAGHALQIDAPAAANRLLLDFLGG